MSSYLFSYERPCCCYYARLLISDHPLPRRHSRVLFADEILKPLMYIFSIQVATLEAHEAIDVVYVLGAIKEQLKKH